MSLDSFYSIVTATCFALVGLWWNVVNAHPDWIKDAQMRVLAGGVYLSFLIPGLMSLGAQIGGDNKLVWRAVFIAAALLGIFFTGRIIAKSRSQAKPGLFRRNRWIVIMIYLTILVFAILPQLALPLGLQPLQIEGFMLALLILIAHGLTWEFMTEST